MVNDVAKQNPPGPTVSTARSLFMPSMDAVRLCGAGPIDAVSAVV
jgi:hypothetical protein